MTFDSPELDRAMAELEKGNYSAAAKLLMPLADGGNPKAQCNLATLYFAGWGVQLNGQRAVDLYRHVAEQNIIEGHISALACNNLAAIYVTGLPGIEPDPKKAQEYRSRARELGFEM